MKQSRSFLGELLPGRQNGFVATSLIGIAVKMHLGGYNLAAISQVDCAQKIDMTRVEFTTILGIPPLPEQFEGFLFDGRAQLVDLDKHGDRDRGNLGAGVGPDLDKPFLFQVHAMLPGSGLG